MATATVPGGASFVSPTVRELFSWDITPQYRAQQVLAFGSFVPIGTTIRPSSYDLDLRLLADRNWAKHSVGLDLRVAWAMFSELQDPMTMAILSSERQQMIVGIGTRYRYDITHRWSSEAGGGVLFVKQLGDMGASAINYNLNTAIRYGHEYGTAELSYAHTVAPNVFIAQTFISDGVYLRGSLPIGGETSRVFAGASTGLVHSRQLSLTGMAQTTGTVTVWLADAGIGWAPRDEVDLGIRYQIIEQVGNPMDISPIPSFSRNSVIFSISGRYPGRIPVEGYKEGRRVDGKDGTTRDDSKRWEGGRDRRR
jgi:hypothetical protein